MEALLKEFLNNRINIKEFINLLINNKYKVNENEIILLLDKEKDEERRLCREIFQSNQEPPRSLQEEAHLCGEVRT